MNTCPNIDNASSHSIWRRTQSLLLTTHGANSTYLLSCILPFFAAFKELMTLNLAQRS